MRKQIQEHETINKTMDESHPAARPHLEKLNQPLKLSGINFAPCPCRTSTSFVRELFKEAFHRIPELVFQSFKAVVVI